MEDVCEDSCTGLAAPVSGIHERFRYGGGGDHPLSWPMREENREDLAADNIVKPEGADAVLVMMRYAARGVGGESRAMSIGIRGQRELVR